MVAKGVKRAPACLAPTHGRVDCERPSQAAADRGWETHLLSEVGFAKRARVVLPAVPELASIRYSQVTALFGDGARGPAPRRDAAHVGQDVKPSLCRSVVGEAASAMQNGVGLSSARALAKEVAKLGTFFPSTGKASAQAAP